MIAIISFWGQQHKFYIHFIATLYSESRVIIRPLNIQPWGNGKTPKWWGIGLYKNMIVLRSLLQTYGMLVSWLQQVGIQADE